MARVDHHPDGRSRLSVLAQAGRLKAAPTGRCGADLHGPRKLARTFSVRVAGHKGPPRIIIAVMTLACVAACAVPPRALIPSAPVLLAVVTWNMHAGRGDLPRLLDDVRSGRAAGVSVRDFVLLVQEAIESGEHDVVALGKARNLSTFFSEVRRTSRGVSGNAIVSTRPLVMPSSIELPRQRQRRAALATTIEIGGQRVLVVNAHFENRTTLLRTLFSDTARGRQADALLNALPSAGPVVLGGDFNTWLGPREPAWQKLAARFPDTPGGPFEPTFRDRLVLDHLFFDVPDQWQVVRVVAKDAYGSDHRPVIGLISCPRCVPSAQSPRSSP
jgi:endonuclease/exonuclease/phosphatase family metal-dependent hydrolase